MKRVGVLVVLIALLGTGAYCKPGAGMPPGMPGMMHRIPGFPGNMTPAGHVPSTMYGFIDRSGKMVIKPNYKWAGDFSEGLAAVQMTSHKWGFIDKSGRMVIKPKFDRALSFSQGLAAVQVGEKWGYIDKTGKVVIKPKYWFALKFAEDRGVVCTEQSATGSGDTFSVSYRLGVIDRRGRMVIQPNFKWIERQYHDGLICGRMISPGPNGRRVIIDKTGRVVAELNSYDTVEKFVNGLAVVGKGSKWGVINTKGKLVIKPIYDRLSIGDNGLITVNIGKKSGYVDTSGRMVIKPRYCEMAFPFSDGLGLIVIHNKRYYLDKTGKIMITVNNTTDSCTYDESFHEGRAVTVLHGKYGYIDKTGKMVIKPQFDSAHVFHDGLAVVGIRK